MKPSHVAPRPSFLRTSSGYADFVLPNDWLTQNSCLLPWPPICSRPRAYQRTYAMTSVSIKASPRAYGPDPAHTKGKNSTIGSSGWPPFIPCEGSTLTPKAGGTVGRSCALSWNEQDLFHKWDKTYFFVLSSGDYGFPSDDKFPIPRRAAAYVSYIRLYDLFEKELLRKSIFLSICFCG
jgi:hypothetical protein